MTHTAHTHAAALPAPQLTPAPAPRCLDEAAALSGAADATMPAEGFQSMPAAPQPPDMFAPAPWRAALERAIASDPTGKKGVAERLGVSRPYVSRITTGHIGRASPLFIQRVIDTLMQVDCPHLQRPLPPGQCRSYASRSYTQVSSFEVDHWRACRRCPNNALRARIGSDRPAAPQQQGEAA